MPKKAEPRLNNPLLRKMLPVLRRVEADKERRKRDRLQKRERKNARLNNIQRTLRTMYGFKKAEVLRSHQFVQEVERLRKDKSLGEDFTVKDIEPSSPLDKDTSQHDIAVNAEKAKPIKERIKNFLAYMLRTGKDRDTDFKEEQLEKKRQAKEELRHEREMRKKDRAERMESGRRPAHPTLGSVFDAIPVIVDLTDD
jgi:hypothetical protein